MEPYRADRVVRVLTGVVTVFYYLAWLALVLVVVMWPVMALVGDYDSVEVRVRVDTPAGTLVSDWDPAAEGFELDEVNGELDVPLGVAPVWLRVVAWLWQMATTVLAVFLVHHLRRVFVRVREGAPFDAQNAWRLRTVGILFLVVNVMYSAYEFFMAVVVTRALDARSSIDLGASPDLNTQEIFLALVLIALAEIFRRGSQLEDEQSLVV